MNEKPILFSTEMVRAILEDRKTQTRRVIKPQPVKQSDDTWKVESNSASGYSTEKAMRSILDIYCPYGKAGDRLWVRETWAHDDPNCKDVRCGNRDHIWWKANETKIVADSFAGSAHWRSAIHMPRWASRITLEIVNVRVERIWEISDSDVQAEGISVPHGSVSTHYDHFMMLWDSINGERGYGWDVNPWVWVIEFKRLRGM